MADDDGTMDGQVPEAVDQALLNPFQKVDVMSPTVADIR
jgi:hypothetical protein